MHLEVDHAFILVEQKAKVAQLLIDFGLYEDFSRDHLGQGTSNRRFTFANGMLELLWLRDKEEAMNGPGQALKFVERSDSRLASPFGLVFNQCNDIKKIESGPTDTLLPFEGWSYQPDYFKAPMSFHVGENSKDITEPLCIYVPFIAPHQREKDSGQFRTLSQISIHTPKKGNSNVLDVVDKADRLSIIASDQHLMELTLDNYRQGETKDFRPDIPLVIHY